MAFNSIVSAIIPCFNHGKYIDDAIQSVLSQTYQINEIIVIDDGSNDEFTVKRLSKYKDNSKIKVIRISNSGPSKARNIGAKNSSGDLIFFIDADDYCSSNFVEKAVEILEINHEVGGVSCGVQIVGSIDKKYIPAGGDHEAFLLEPQALNFGVVRKSCWEAVGGYDETMKEVGYEDWDFWIKITKLGYSVHVLNEYLFFYRWHDYENSRRSKSHKYRLEILKHLINKHHDSYSKHFASVIIGKEVKLKRVLQEKRQFEESLEYRIGKIILTPFRVVQKIIDRKIL